MARKAAALGLAAVLGSAAAGSVSLTDSNFDTEVFDSGKNAFIKFQAPWCVSTQTFQNDLPRRCRLRAVLSTPVFDVCAAARAVRVTSFGAESGPSELTRLLGR